MINKNYFNIGEFSKLIKTSRKNLIFFDRIGVFKPDYSDPQNGYRYYSMLKFNEYISFLNLRNSGYTLSEIREYNKSKSSELYYSTLNNVLEFNKNQLREIELTIKKIELDIKTKFEYDKNKNDNLPFICKLPLSRIYQVKIDNSFKSFDFFTNIIEKFDYLSYNIGTTKDFNDVYNGDFYTYKHLFSVVIDDDFKQNVINLPEGYYLCIYEKGEFENAKSRAYKKILYYIENNNLNTIGDFYETAIVSNFCAQNIDEYILKITVRLALS